MKLPALAFLLLPFALHAQTVTCEISFTSSTTVGASNVLFLSRSPLVLTNLAQGSYRFSIGTNRLVRATLSPGLWFCGVTAQFAPLESAPALLTITVPSPVSQLNATFP